MKQGSHHSGDWGVHTPDDLLSPEPLRIEMGIIDSPDSRLTVAVRTDMNGCEGKMIDWWFRFFETTEHIKWWHPLDHVSFQGWDKHWKKGDQYIGATVEATEKLAQFPAVRAQLKFHDAHDFFTTNAIEHAHKHQWVSAVICSSIGFGDQIILDEDGDPTDGEMLHLARDTDFGCVLRSRFLLGKRSPVSESIALNLMRHCYNEFTYLSHFLPSLYHAENPRTSTPRPW